MAEIRIESLRGEQIAQHLQELAELRIAVFRDWPYLYDGSLDYEKKYLDTYVESPRSLAVLVWDGARCVGASTVVPLADAGAESQQPFLDHGYNLAEVDYFGESVLLKPYRGRGLGVRFFEARETHARELNLPLCAFCAVERPADHPAKPKDYVPNDAFWGRRGYHKVPRMVTTYSWPDVGESVSTAKPMTFWLRDLRKNA